MWKKAPEFQRKAMSRMYRGKEIFKPLNTGWIDEKSNCTMVYPLERCQAVDNNLVHTNEP